MDPKINTFILRDIWRESNELHWFPIHGNSMKPFLSDGDSILVNHDISILHQGDIVVFQNDDGLIAHRLIKTKKFPNKSSIYYTKGDNRTRFDPPMVEKDILGKVLSIRKNGREFELTTIEWQVKNEILAFCHYIMGNFFQITRKIKHSFQNRSN